MRAAGGGFQHLLAAHEEDISTHALRLQSSLQVCGNTWRTPPAYEHIAASRDDMAVPDSSQLALARDCIQHSLDRMQDELDPQGAIFRRSRPEQHHHQFGRVRRRRSSSVDFQLAELKHSKQHFVDVLTDMANALPMDQEAHRGLRCSRSPRCLSRSSRRSGSPTSLRTCSKRSLSGGASRCMSFRDDVPALPDSASVALAQCRDRITETLEAMTSDLQASDERLAAVLTDPGRAVRSRRQSPSGGLPRRLGPTALSWARSAPRTTASSESVCCATRDAAEQATLEKAAAMTASTTVSSASRSERRPPLAQQETRLLDLSPSEVLLIQYMRARAKEQHPALQAERQGR
eukprot:TRINITY_DN27759_c0_g1_i2.p1 TRINITY_DN27759_c0_g1~~TRINITY_DN27759_c0_g1_i2.p1  ORF type:complete len:348 (-),score=49.53 TRINITY_DN27759_c0_g1_i2:139-1182(-)